MVSRHASDWPKSRDVLGHTGAHQRLEIAISKLSASYRLARLACPDLRYRWPMAAIGIVTVIAVACGGVNSSSEPDASLSSGPGSPEPALVEAVAQELPLDFNISAYQGEEFLGGKEVRFSEVVAQGKPVVLNFWAGLCPPCRAEMPDLQAVYEEFSDHILLFGLDVGPFTGLGSNQDAIDLIEELGVTYPAGKTDQSQVISKYKVLGMPTTSFIKPDGSVLNKWTGALNQSKLKELVEKLIAASS